MATVSKARSLTLVSVAYVLAIAVAVVWLVVGPYAPTTLARHPDRRPAGDVVIFVFSRIYRNSSFYDAYWSVIPPLLLFYWGIAAPMSTCCASGYHLVVVLWAIRLTANWVYAFPGLHHEDWRYPMFKQRAGRFEILADLVAIHLIPTLRSSWPWSRCTSR